MYNFIKQYLLILLVLLMPSMNIASKALDTDEFYNSAGNAAKMRLTKEDPFAKQSTPSQVASLEYPQTLLASYLVTPVKNTMQTVREVMEFAVQNPKKTIVIGTLLAMQFTTVAADCTCWCFNTTSGQRIYEGIAPNINFCCQNICIKQRFDCDGCYPR